MTERKKAIQNPIEFEGQERVDQKTNRGESNVKTTLPQYNPSASQFDPLQSYRGKLTYDFEKAKIDLWKDAQMKGQRIDIERQMCELKLIYQTHLAAMACTVYCGSSGTMFYSLGEPDGGKIVSHALLSVKQYASRIYMGGYPEHRALLEITWEGDGRIVFPFIEDGVDPKYFLKKLKGHGVLLLVSGRTEAKAAEALLAYSISSAESVELPYRHGWCQMSDGHWHFAMPDEKTLQEVVGS